jgi:uncharacterized protein YuzE
MRRDAMPVRISHDPEADAVFIKLADEHPVESEEVSPGVVLDFTEDGRVTGIEILFASKTLAPGDWRKAPMPGSAKAHAAE